MPAGNYAFIDSQNLHLGILSAGWELDLAKFRVFLRDKFDVTQAFIFIGYSPTNQSLYTAMQRMGYTIVFKPVVKFKKDGHWEQKGNVDTDLVLYAAALEFNNYDEAIIVSGDGDFLCLYDFLESNEKLHAIVIPNKRQYSSLLNKHSEKLYFINDQRNKLGRK
jgi:uncharacterized LabA/DUF88 family protein